ncbi:hypothetical protein FRB96_005275 [Tulasnella sp. 330]|nr:hypothetical protein FRB96_005275 [Tulasnella sp. 330]KAG8877907.1 hypothetical protein FRB98_006488 [Tulasnella sp. 332]KAG8880357.1 hypothetical protein FRB97_000894 [Tulasnella sp. 331]
MSTTIQAIFIRGHEARDAPKPHTVYRIEVQGPIRTWQVWRRYSEFDDLHTELASSTGAPPPTSLPGKHTFSILGRFNEAAIVEERTRGLELWLRAIVGNKDSKWRDALAFRDFLMMPAVTATSSSTGTATTASSAPAQFTSSSWLDEHSELQSLIRDIRSDVNKRNALSDAGDISSSHQSNVGAKKKLSTLLTRIGGLAKGLDDLGAAGMSEGEKQRRGDMIARLQDECEKLGKMVIASRQSTRPFSSNSAAQQSPASQADREALLGGARSGGKAPVTRVFGAAALETDKTRPLDDAGLVQLQQTEVDNQDAQLSQLSTILQRQKQIGVAIGSEIAEQIEILDRLSNDVDTVGGKLAGAKKQLNKLG